jgi:hypothetical protein
LRSTNQFPLKYFVDKKILKKIIEVGYKIMLENLVPINAFLSINLKDDFLKLGL